MEFRVDKGTGYMYSYQPKHPCANSAGKVFCVEIKTLSILFGSVLE